MSKSLPENARKLLDGKNFATVATLNPDGSPQASTMWITRENDDLLFSITTTRQKYKNLTRDPRVSVLVPKEDPQRGYLEVRGEATLTENGGKELINDLYNKYIGEGKYEWDPEGTVRVVARVTPQRVVWHEQ